ncbi:MAG: 30S ribosomal protein S17 [Candidatus Pacebacteria bacterium]|nr:30S ribosomal protein S17 [Candidatus Paceibacterota bacterium]
MDTAKQQNKTAKKALVGTVVSDKMQKTVVVLVDRFVKDTKYKKYYKTNKKYKAHDETNQYKVGDKVMIVETIPMSRINILKLLD